MLGLCMIRDRDTDKYRSEHGKHQCLHKSHEYLQHEKRDRCAKRRQKSRNNKQYLPRKYVPEQAEGERYYLSKFRDKFKYPHKKLNRTLEGEKFAHVCPDADRTHGKNVNEKYGDGCNGQSGIEVACRRPEKRDKDMLCSAHLVKPDGADTREYAEPVGREDKKKRSRNQREIFFRRRTRPEYALCHGDKSLNKKLQHILECGGDHRNPPAHAKRDKNQERHHDPARQKRIGHRKSQYRKQLFRSNLNMRHNEYIISAFVVLFKPQPGTTHAILVASRQGLRYEFLTSRC